MSCIIGGIEMKLLKCTSFLLAMAAISYSASAAESYNLANDFSVENGNPNGQWTYGKYTSGLDTNYFQVFATPGGPNIGVLNGNDLTGLTVWSDGGDPNIIKNTLSTDIITDSAFGVISFHAGKLTFGPYLGPTVARFTAPGSGKWLVDATFATVQVVNGSPGAWVCYESACDLVAATLPAFPDTAGYSDLLDLEQGDTIDFVVWGNNSQNKTTEVSAMVTEYVLNVGVDIKPRSDPNSINLCSNGAVPIAILGSDSFNVFDTDTTTLKFADAGVKVVGKKDKQLCSFEDVNVDGFSDLVCHFLTMDIAGISGETASASVSGVLLDGTKIQGMDSINIVKDTCD